MLRHVIFHLNILADPILLRRHYQQGLAKLMHTRYGKTQQFWADIQDKIFADWASYHADLNFSGDDGMSDICEGRFRTTRALFRLAKMPEPSKQEISQLAEDLINQAPQSGDALFPESHEILAWLTEKNVQIIIISYYPEEQLKAILLGANVADNITFVGADTFEHYEMDKPYFEYLLNKLKVQASECLYVDKQKTTLDIAEKIGMKKSLIEGSSDLKQLKKHLTSLL